MLRHGMLLSALCLFAAIVAGCGDDSVAVDAPPPNTAAKTTLQSIAESGQPIGSGGGVIQEAIEKIRPTDAAKADKLQAQLDQLISTQNPTEIKKIASEMAAQL